MDQQFFFGGDGVRPVRARELHRRVVALMVLLAVGTATVGAQTPPRRVALDVKSRSAEKADLAAAKAGTLASLRRSGWARITEVGEDYSVWLTRYGREAEGGGIRVSLVVEFRTPAMLSSGTLLRSRRTVMWLPSDLAPSPTGSIASVIRQEFERESDEFHREAAVVGERVSDVVRELVAEASEQSGWWRPNGPIR